MNHSWKVEQKDPQWAIESVLNALVSLRHLEELDLLLNHPMNTRPIKINRLGPMRTISVTWWTDRSPTSEDVYRYTAELIKKSPDLECLCLRQTSNLQCLLSEILDGSQHLRLQKLKLEGWSGHLNVTSFPHLHHLSSLSFPAMRENQPPVLINDLRESRILVRAIEAGSVAPELLDYLASYSGLERLCLTNFGARLGIDHFYQNILPCHSAFLKNLSIHHQPRFSVAFNEIAASSISACRSLEHLSLSVLTHGYHKNRNDTDPVVRTFSSFENGLDST